MGYYRVEHAVTGRAVCKSTECKAGGIKIPKGDIRFGVLVETDRFTGWSWKHWGCVTPQQIHNLSEAVGTASELDGWDEIPVEYQDKIREALAEGHVNDEDWNGDVECNRPGRKGMRVHVPRNAKKRKHETDSEEGDDSKDVENVRDSKAADSSSETKPKKQKVKKVKAEVKEEDEAFVANEHDSPVAPKSKSKKRGKRTAVKDENDEVETKPKARRVNHKMVVKDEPTDDDNKGSFSPPPKRKHRAQVKVEPRDSEPTVMKLERPVKQEDDDSENTIPKQSKHKSRLRKVEISIKEEDASSTGLKKQRKRKDPRKAKDTTGSDLDAENENIKHTSRPYFEKRSPKMKREQAESPDDALRSQTANLTQSGPVSENRLAESHTQNARKGLKLENGTLDTEDEDVKQKAGLKTKSTNTKNPKRRTQPLQNVDEAPASLRRSSRKK